MSIQAAEEVSDRDKTLAIVLGASKWLKSPELSSPQSFKNSASDFVAYLLNHEGFGLPYANLLNAFDFDDSPSQLLERFAAFLRERTETFKQASVAPANLLFFYVGHGSFAGNDYILALKNTNPEIEAASSLRMADLASTIQTHTPHIRRFIILDCCFAAAAYQQFQSAPIQIAVQRTSSVFPKHGTALLCASGARDPAKAPIGSQHTMFSGALLRVLRGGSNEFPKLLSLSDVGQLAAEIIHSDFLDLAVRPEVHTPDQRDGDIAQVPLFPNGALRIDFLKRLLAVEARVAKIENGESTLAVMAGDGLSVTSSTDIDPLRHDEMPLEVAISLHRWRKSCSLGNAWIATVAASTILIFIDFLMDNQSTWISHVIRHLILSYRWLAVLLVVISCFPHRTTRPYRIARFNTERTEGFRFSDLILRPHIILRSVRLVIAPALRRGYDESWAKKPEALAAQSGLIVEFYTIPLESIRYYLGVAVLICQILLILAMQTVAGTAPTE